MTISTEHAPQAFRYVDTNDYQQEQSAPRLQTRGPGGPGYPPPPGARLLRTWLLSSLPIRLRIWLWISVRGGLRSSYRRTAILWRTATTGMDIITKTESYWS